MPRNLGIAEEQVHLSTKNAFNTFDAEPDEYRMSDFIPVTEEPSPYRHLENMPVKEILRHINEEDKTVAPAVEKALPQIEELITAIADRMLAGGKLYYIGAGT